jgi:ATP-binding protein involved in chromosome partitioning
MPPPAGAMNKINLEGVKHLVAIASGKGGVGKSTVAANLALALKMHGQRVGLLDADIYGPSVPRMFGLSTLANPTKDQFPLERFGVKLISMGFFVNPEQAVIWRGPMVHGALSQFLGDFNWAPLDYLLVDMPPGTGDAQITMSQAAPLSGAVIVTMPQEVSITVARRGLEMFRQVRVPVLGVIENMSHFVGEDGKTYELFGHGGGKKLADAAGLPLLGQIPIDPKVAECGDAGEPIVHKHPDSAVSKAFLALASRVMEELHRQPTQQELPSLQI